MSNKVTDVVATSTVNKIIFRNRTSGWSVFSIFHNGKLITCTGILPEIALSGENEIKISGCYERTKYGLQIKADAIIPVEQDVNSADGVLKLLQKLPDIGAAKAKKLIETMGHKEAWELACNNPERIGVKAANVENAKRIIKSILSNYSANEFFYGAGLTDNEINKIIIYYKSKGISEENIKTEYIANPYKITEIHGFGYKKVDAIAIKSGVGELHPCRISAAVKYFLEESTENNGNTWTNGKKLCLMIEKMLSESYKKVADENKIKKNETENDCNETYFSLIRNEIYKLDKEGFVYIDESKRVFLSSLLNDEKIIFEAANTVYAD